MLNLVVAVLFGAALAYFLDRDRGRQRRDAARDRAADAGHRLGSQVSGLRHRPQGAVDGSGDEASIGDGQGGQAEPVSSSMAQGE